MKANPYAAELKAENDMLLGVLESNAEMLARIAELEAALYECMTDPGALAYRTHSYAKKRIQFINGIVHTALKDADTVAIATNALKGTK